ncbi:MAG: nucleotidyltransferase family protein [Ferruginibacter sp.]
MNSVLEILKAHKQELFSEYPIKSLALFGSFSRGDFNETSDVDIMVEMSEPKAFAFIDLSYALENILQRKVDLVSKNGIKEKYYNYLEKDIQYV